MSAAAIRAGAAYIELTIRDKVTNGLKEASKRLQSFADELTNVGARVMAMGASIVAPLAAMAYQFAKTASPEALTAFDRLYGSLVDLSQVVGGAVLPVISDLADRAAKILGRVVDWANSNRDLIATVFKVGAALVAGGAAMVAIGKAVGILAAGISALSVASGMLAAGIGALGGVLAAIATPMGLAAAAATGIAVALLQAGGAGEAAMGWLSEAFGTLKVDALAAWKGIGDALASGDIALAAKVLWLTLKMEWQKGINFINQLWQPAKTYFMQIWQDAGFGIARFFNDAWAEIAKAAADTFAGLGTIFDYMTNGFSKSWGSLVDMMSREIVTIMGLFDSSIDELAAHKEIYDARKRSDRESDAETTRSAMEREDKRKKRHTEINDEQERANQNLAAAQAQADDDRQRSFDADLAATEEAARKAREEWEATLKEAATSTGPKMTKFERNILAGTKPIAADADNIESKGTFNALSAGLMGADSLSERQAKATESTAENTRRLLQMAQKGRLVFAN